MLKKDVAGTPPISVFAHTNSPPRPRLAAAAAPAPAVHARQVLSTSQDPRAPAVTSFLSSSPRPPPPVPVVSSSPATVSRFPAPAPISRFPAPASVAHHPLPSYDPQANAAAAPPPSLLASARPPAPFNYSTPAVVPPQPLSTLPRAPFHVAPPQPFVHNPAQYAPVTRSASPASYSSFITSPTQPDTHNPLPSLLATEAAERHIAHLKEQLVAQRELSRVQLATQHAHFTRMLAAQNQQSEQRHLQLLEHIRVFQQEHNNTRQLQLTPPTNSYYPPPASPEVDNAFAPSGTHSQSVDHAHHYQSPAPAPAPVSPSAPTCHAVTPDSLLQATTFPSRFATNRSHITPAYFPCPSTELDPATPTGLALAQKQLRQLTPASSPTKLSHTDPASVAAFLRLFTDTESHLKVRLSNLQNFPLALCSDFFATDGPASLSSGDSRLASILSDHQTQSFPFWMRLHQLRELLSNYASAHAPPLHTLVCELTPLPTTVSYSKFSVSLLRQLQQTTKELTIHSTHFDTGAPGVDDQLTASAFVIDHILPPAWVTYFTCYLTSIVLKQIPLLDQRAPPFALGLLSYLIASAKPLPSMTAVMVQQNHTIVTANCYSPLLSNREVHSQTFGSDATVPQSAFNPHYDCHATQIIVSRSAMSRLAYQSQ